MAFLRTYLPWVLAALIVLTAQSAAVARTAPGPSGQIEICSGVGPTMVYVDETGKPVSAPHICPDYALSLIVALHVPALPMPQRTGRTLTHAVQVQPVALPAIRTPHTARGPPVLA